VNSVSTNAEHGFRWGCRGGAWGILWPMTTPPPTFDADLALTLAAENRELRELFEAVAQELERLACRRESDPAGFLARAQRIRQRLHAT
jgi:hypothetical protein